MCGQIRNTIGTLGRASMTAPPLRPRGSERVRALPANSEIGDLLGKCLKRSRAFDAGERLIVQGEPNRELCRVVAGELAVCQKTPVGDEAVIAFYYPGDLLLPAAPAECWTHSVRALSEGRLEIYRLDDVRQVCQGDGRLAHELFLVACRVLSERIECAARLRSLSVEGRFAAFLLEAGQRIGTARAGGLTLSLPMSRTDIASYLGLRTETLSRIIRRWRDRGLIDLESARRISIGDVALLETLAQDLPLSAAAAAQSG